MPYRSPSMPIKYGCALSISAKQIGSVSPRSACSAVMPHRRSTSTSSTNRSFNRERSVGNTFRANKSRSSPKSRNVEDTNTRAEREAEDMTSTT